MKKKTTPTEAKLIAAAIANTFPKRTRKTPCRKGGMLDVALAKVRELKGEIKCLSDKLIESYHRIDGLRESNAHASSVCSEAQAAERVLTDALNRSTDEINTLKSANESLYDGAKLVEADFQKRMEVGQNQVDQLQDQVRGLKSGAAAYVQEVTCNYVKYDREINELKTARDIAKSMQNNYWNLLVDARQMHVDARDMSADELNKKDLQIANLTEKLERERAAHTMTDLSRSERIDELLVIEKALTDRLHSIWRQSTAKPVSTLSKVWSWLTQIR